MRAEIGCVALLLGVMGCLTSAAASENAAGAAEKGLSPIILSPITLSPITLQANQAQPSDVTTTRTLGVCQVIPNAANATPSIEYVFDPKVSGQGYFFL